MGYLLVESVAETLGSPVATFVLLLAIALLIPPVFERLRLPGLVGLLAAGVVFGQSGLGLLDADAETMKLLSEIGKTYLMFVAGLEIDLALFRKTRNRSLVFGVLTFLLPFVSGIALGLFFNFGPLAAVLIGSLLASHTLLAYPIIQRLGIAADEAVTVSVGATIVTDITALVVLAICLGVSKGNFTAVQLTVLLGSLGAYTAAVLLGLGRLSQAFFRTHAEDEGNQFLFVMLSVFLAAVVAQLIGVEGIIGAFLAGLAINRVLGSGPVKEKIEFVGGVLFIPMFFINMGLLLDLDALMLLLNSVALPLAIVGTLLGSKWLAAMMTKQLFGYSWTQMWTMWSLSVPQVAATLAAALVGYEAGIINVQVFNSVILLMLVTSVVGPLTTARTARQLAIASVGETEKTESWLPVPKEAEQPANHFTVVAPVANPETEHFLLELAAMVAQYESGRVVPLAVALAQQRMDSPKLTRSLEMCQARLAQATDIQSQFSVSVDPVLRVEQGVPQAICHVSREVDANLIVLGLGHQSRLEASVLNTIHDDVLWSAHCPVVIARLLTSPTAIKRVLIPIDTPTPYTLRVLRFAQVLAAANQGEVTLLHVHSAIASKSSLSYLQTQLEAMTHSLPPLRVKTTVRLVSSENLVGAIADEAALHDVVVVRSQRRRMSTGLSLGTMTGPLLAYLSGSVILVGEPYASRSADSRT